ncbi:MAG: hypothetical protein G3M70_07965 [Candidatus Nitronauta litoralis]|uniref:Uncharacterized protein n=1 Tax=Candidatus Nitronauta litoralis TaxID=2705533 RepID=A0A7T0BVK6_9BACT|nr:MAG: hypothetical protein G3M70_07965 [Candidatus Nitronauta litoralis]
MAELEGKDPDRYQEMVVATKKVDLPKALDLYKKIDAMTEWEVYLLRHEKWKKKWEEDPDFRDRELEARSDKFDALKVARQKEYARKRVDLKVLQVRDSTGREESWKKKTPWEQSVLLKEACLYYRDLEQRHSVDRRRIDLPARQESFLMEQRATGITPSEECDKWIALSQSPNQVALSLSNLRRSMNYYFFRRMSDELGLPGEAQHDLENRLSKMTHDFESY